MSHTSHTKVSVNLVYLISVQGIKSTSSSGFRLGRLKVCMWPLATYVAKYTISKAEKKWNGKF